MVVYCNLMAGVFSVLLFVFMLVLVWGLIEPQSLARIARFKKPVRRSHYVMWFGSLAVILLIMIVVTTPKPTTTLNVQNASANIAKSAMRNSSSNSATTSNTTTKQLFETQPVAYITTTEEDGTLSKGQTQIIQTGINGVETQVYNAVYNGGIQVSKTLVSQSVTTQPTNEVIADGTYVAPVSVPTAVSTPVPPPSSANIQTTTPVSCSPLSDENTCYEPGEYCRESDAGTSGIAGDGKSITCENNNGLRWEPN
jgi:cytoskeletal protein RodZ